jgi:integrase
MSNLGRALGGGNLYQVRRGRHVQWMLDWKDGQGRRRRQAMGSDKRVAERMRAELISQRDMEMAGLGTVEGQARALAEIHQLYLGDLRSRVGGKQIENVTSRLKRMLPRLHAKRVRDLSVLEVMRYRSDLIQSGLSHRTANCAVGALKAMLTWAASAQLIAENPLRNLKPLPYREEHQRHVRRALSDAEIEKFLAAAQEDDREMAAFWAAKTTVANGTKGAKFEERRRLPRVPQTLLWRTLIECGARWGELTGTTWADLDAEQQTLRLRATTTKSGRTRWVPLHSELVAELLALRAIHQRARERVVQPRDHVFIGPDGADWAQQTSGARRIFYRTLERASIPRTDSAKSVVDVHSLRHTAASRMARHGVPLVIAQRVLGHSDPALTARAYTHLAVKDLRAAVVMMPSRPVAPQPNDPDHDQDQQRARA